MRAPIGAWKCVTFMTDQPTDVAPDKQRWEFIKEKSKILKKNVLVDVVVDGIFLTFFLKKWFNFLGRFRGR